MTPATAPAVAHEDVLLGPWLAHAAEHVPDGNAILWRDSFDFTDDPTSGIQGMLNMVWVLRSGLANPRIAYLPIDPRSPARRCSPRRSAAGTSRSSTCTSATASSSAT